MVRPIVRDPILLSRRSEPATAVDRQTVQDLRDTFLAHRDSCVGMAANMIGVSRRIIIVSASGVPLLMLNPVITSRRGEYEAEEGCLSLPGVRRTKRFRSITVTFEDESLKRRRTSEFEGFTAQIIQHEIDHCEGILI